MKNGQKIEYVELQALLDEDDSRTQTQLAERVSQQAASDRSREMGKIQKTGRWVLHELNDWQMETRNNTCDILFAQYKRSRICIVQLRK